MPTRPMQRVLFVDDDEVVQRLVQIALERLGGLTVELVSDSANAIAAIGRFKPDMVVLDWIMPHLNGTELFRQIRAHPEMEKIPVVFFTVKAHWRTTEELLALGAAGVISKPFSAKDLSDQLKAIWKGLPEAGGPGA